MVYYRLVIQQAQALSALPEHAVCHTPKTETAQALLKQLQKPHSDISSLKFIQQNYRQVAAHLFLQSLLIALRKQIEVVAIKEKISAIAPQIRQQAHLPLQFLPVVEQLTGLNELPDNVDDEFPEATTLRVFQYIAQTINKNRNQLVTPKEPFRQESPHSLDFLFYLIDSSDNPILFLSQNYPESCSAFLLKYVLNQALPSPGLLESTATYPSDYRIENDQQQMSSSQTRLKLEEIHLFQVGFRLDFKFRLARRRFDFKKYRYHWQALYAVQNQKQELYIVLSEDFGYQSSLFGTDFYLRLLCYPAPVPELGKIQMNITDSRLVALPRHDDETSAGPEIILGDALFSANIL